MQVGNPDRIVKRHVVIADIAITPGTHAIMGQAVDPTIFATGKHRAISAWVRDDLRECGATKAFLVSCTTADSPSVGLAGPIGFGVTSILVATFTARWPRGNFPGRDSARRQWTVWRSVNRVVGWNNWSVDWSGSSRRIPHFPGPIVPHFSRLRNPGVRPWPTGSAEIVLRLSETARPAATILPNYGNRFSGCRNNRNAWRTPCGT